MTVQTSGFAELIIAAKNMLQFIDEGEHLLTLSATEMLRASKSRREENEKITAELRKAVDAANDGPPDEDWFDEVISDTFDMGWTARDGAKAIIRRWDERWYWGEQA